MAEMQIAFGPWRPDDPTLLADGIPRAENVIRTRAGYRPLPSLSEFSSTQIPGVGEITGHFFGKDASQNATLFATANNGAGVAGIYTYQSATDTWVALPTGALNEITTTQRARAVQYNNNLYMTNQDDDLRKWTLGSSTDWTVVSAGLNPRYLAVVKDFLVGAYMDTTANQVRWSAIADPDDWVASAVTQSGSQDVPDAGECRGLVGGEYGVVLMETGIFRMDYVGPPDIFSFTRIENAKGCLEPNSVVAAKGVVYYLSEDGWKAFDGQRVHPIGAERFDRWFRANAVSSKLDTMSAVVAPTEQLIVFGFNAGVSNEDTNDTVLVYNVVLNEPTYGRLDHHLLGNFVSPGSTVEGLNTFVLSDLTDYQGVWAAGTTYALNEVVAYNNTTWKSLQNGNTGNTPAENAWWTELARTASVDALPASPDDELFKAGSVTFGALLGRKLNSLTGSSLTATLETAEQRLGGTKRAMTESAQLFSEGTGHTRLLQTGGRATPDTPVVFDAARSPVHGIIPSRVEARYHTFRVSLSGTWKHVTGLLVRFSRTADR